MECIDVNNSWHFLSNLRVSKKLCIENARCRTPGPSEFRSSPRSNVRSANFARCFLRFLSLSEGTVLQTVQYYSNSSNVLCTTVLLLNQERIILDKFRRCGVLTVQQHYRLYRNLPSVRGKYTFLQFLYSSTVLDFTS